MPCISWRLAVCRVLELGLPRKQHCLVGRTGSSRHAWLLCNGCLYIHSFALAKEPRRYFGSTWIQRTTKSTAINSFLSTTAFTRPTATRHCSYSLIVDFRCARF